MFSTPADGFRTQDTGNPHLGMRFLIWQCPRVDMTIVEMLAFIAPRSRFGPGFNNEVVGLVEVLAIIGWVGVVEKLLAPSATHPPRNQPAAGDEVNLRQLLCHAQRVLKHR